MATTGSILIVDDDDDILTAGRLLLRKEVAAITTCRNPERIPKLIAENSFDAILLDMNFSPGESSGAQGLLWLKKILQIDPQMVVVMITAHGSVGTAVNAMKRGATDFVAKPWQNEKVVATVSTAVRLARSQREAGELRRTNAVLLAETASADTDLIGDSKQLHDVMTIVRRAGPTDANVLILGENGTGKELIARALHQQSERRENVFLSVDMGSISESLFESELFGHRKGAFTDAHDDRPGRFQAANGGTLFLDEIGNLPLHLQAKLLRVLEERRVMPLGSDVSQEVDVRIVAATNISSHNLHDSAQFRQDLLFRLNTVEVTIPPLRERPDDILPIARYYIEKYSRKYGGEERRLSVSAEAALLSYEWPGNVRALQHAIERAIILSDSAEIDVAALQLNLSHSVSDRQGTGGDSQLLNLDQVECDTIQKALLKHGFNISRAANELGLTRASLYRRMEKHDL